MIFPRPFWFGLVRLGGALAVVLVAFAACSAPTLLPDPATAPLAAPPPRVTAPAVAANPGDAFVIISGGGTPLSNNYSQFLQARGLNDALRARYPTEAVWTFFGAGNHTGTPPTFADARRQLKQDGLIVESWLPGVLSHNRPATRTEILGALKTEILPRVAAGGTLYLFVGDHGELTRAEPRESAITLWQMEKNGEGANAWRSNPDGVLSLSDLRAAFTPGLGAGRVVFCFTCCHSGGFQYLDQSRVAAPNPAWFAGTVPVECAAWSPQAALVRIAGFTATTEDSLAAGCAPDPDPEKWAGYERFIPEALLGVDLMTGARKGPGLPSFADAHIAATLVDRTIDKPHSTAEAFLERYATLIETMLAKHQSLTPAVRAQVERYTRVVGGEAPGAADAAFVAQQKLYARFTAALAEQNPASSKLLLSGTRAELDTAIGPVAGNAGRGGRGGRGGATEETRKLWTDTIRPAWKAALTANQVAGVPAPAREFELYLIGLEEKNPRRDLTPGNRDAVRNEVFWRSGSAIPALVDPAKVAAVTRWDADRRRAVLDWARASTDAAVRAAGEKWGGPVRPAARPAAANAVSGPPRAARKEALQRTLFYRRVLGAWDFLLALDERPALAQLSALLELERTPLPAPMI